MSRLGWTNGTLESSELSFAVVRTCRRVTRCTEINLVVGVNAASRFLESLLSSASADTAIDPADYSAGCLPCSLRLRTSCVIHFSPPDGCSFLHLLMASNRLSRAEKASVP